MTPDQLITIAAADVRRALVQPGDIRAEIEFQNDINGLLARLDDGVTLEAIAAPSQPAAPPAIRTLRVLHGGVGSARNGAHAQPPPFRFKMTG